MTKTPTGEAYEGEASEFRIEQLFGSKTRARLLGIFLGTPDRSFYVRELTRRIDAQLNSVRRELKNLVDVGIVLEVEGKILPTESDHPVADDGAILKSEKKRYYRANTAFPLFEDLRNVIGKAWILMNNQLVRSIRELGDVECILLTGKFLENAAVPTDVLIVGDLDPADVEKVIHTFEGDVGREVNYTLMPRAEYTYRREVGDRFLSTILDAKHMMLYKRTKAVV